MSGRRLHVCGQFLTLIEALHGQLATLLPALPDSIENISIGSKDSCTCFTHELAACRCEGHSALLALRNVHNRADCKIDSTRRQALLIARKLSWNGFSQV